VICASLGSMNIVTLNSNEKTIAISDLRRKFGEVEKALPFVDHFILTKRKE